MIRSQIILCAVLLAMGVACQKRPARAAYKVPLNCAHVTIKDFTKPCHPLSNGNLSCDAVIVHASCIEPIH